jgi:Ca2+-binding EF-hand superfamily protein
MQAHALRLAPGKVGSNVVDGVDALVAPVAAALAANMTRTLMLFREWDKDGSGSVDRDEFARALQVLGLDAGATTSNALFDALDTDHSGSIEFSELHVRVRQRADVTKTRRRQQQQPPPKARAVHDHAATSSATAAVETLKRTLAARLQRTVDLFHDMDQDGSGAVDRLEFASVVQRLVSDANKATCDALFDSLDVDQSGYLEYTELHARLRARRTGATRQAAAHAQGVTVRTLARQEAVPGRSACSGPRDGHDESSQYPAGIGGAAGGGVGRLPTLPRNTLPARHRRVGRRLPLKARAADDDLPPLDTTRNTAAQLQSGLKWQWL